MSASWVEIVGYLASALVAVSLMMSNVTRLRWVNLVGALVFASYGALVKAWPVLAVNLFIALVDAWYLARTRRGKDFFTLLPLQGCDAYGRKFLLFHQRDIQRFFPEFTLEGVQDRAGFLVLRNMLPVGAFFYRIRPAGDVEIVLDYVSKEYRDGKNAEFLFRILNERFSGKAHRFVAQASTRAHRRYLEREGFEVAPESPELLQRAII